VAATFVLQTIGLVAFAEGTVIRLEGQPPVGIVDACSGLSMLMVFFALATALVLLVRRSPLEKALILASALPIALLANLLRIVLTVLLARYGSDQIAHKVYHDWAGLVMMPMAVGMLLLELRLLSWIFVPRQRKEKALPQLAAWAGAPLAATKPTSKPAAAAKPTGKPAAAVSANGK
jgi:exosortase/archaeosortase family protein